MSDAINNACVALRRAASTLRDAAGGEPRVNPVGVAEEVALGCETALAELRKFASGPERLR